MPIRADSANLVQRKKGDSLFVEMTGVGELSCPALPSKSDAILSCIEEFAPVVSQIGTIF